MAQDLEDRKWNFEANELPYKKQLYAKALRLTRSPVDADDLVQDTYLRAFRFYHRFQEGSNLRAWLSTIMKNTFINMYRRSRREPVTVEVSDLQDTLKQVSTAGATVPTDPEIEILAGEVDRGVPLGLYSGFIRLPVLLQRGKPFQ